MAAREPRDISRACLAAMVAPTDRAGYLLPASAR